MNTTLKCLLLVALSVLLVGCNSDDTTSPDVFLDGDGEIADGDLSSFDGDADLDETDNYETPETDIADSSLVINEIVAKSKDDNDETLPDWVEFYNPGSSIEIGGYLLRDENDENAFAFPDGTVIGSGEYFVIEKDESGEFGFPFGLGKADSVRLFNDADELIDSAVWDDGDSPEAASWGRIPNGQGDFKTLYTPTKGSENIDNTDDTLPTGLCDDDDPNTVRPETWNRLSHCSGVEPDYDQLFDDTVVHRIDIVIDPGDYQDTMDDLENLYGHSHPPMETATDSGDQMVPPPDDPMESGEDPMWVPVTVKYNGDTWDYVGMRYKGNSSLRSAYQSGVKKLSFRLNFDKYEDDHPAYADQRFFGFKKMTFSNGYKDNSLMRDKLAADIFRAGGVPAARGAFVRIYVDFGEGETYFGLYTMIEDPSDEMLDQQFEDASGNLYKPEGQGAAFVSFDQDSFEKKTNEDDSNWSDVISVFSALHANTSEEQWRAGLEAVFDVAGFLKCLAYNQAMVNWDSYGIMAHNYYLYADPSNDGKITWFPWDLNEALLVGGMSSSISESVMLDQVGSQWPMIRLLLDDSTYRNQYQAHLASALEIGFEIDFVSSKIRAYHELISPYVVGFKPEQSPYTFLQSPSDFTNSVDTASDALIPHVTNRHSTVRDALGL